MQEQRRGGVVCSNSAARFPADGVIKADEEK